MAGATRESRPRTRELYRSSTLTIEDHRCDGRDPARCGEEASSVHQIAFVRHGAFQKYVRGGELLVDANHAIFFHRDEPYRIRHPAGGDVCTAFTLREDLLMDLLAAHDPAARERECAVFGATHAPCDARSHLLVGKLCQRLEAGACEDLLVEELSLELCEAAVRRIPMRRARGDAPRRASTQRAHMDLVEASQLVLQKRMGERLMLDDVARSVHSSPFHLARIFQRETGSPMHRYLNRLRLREALARMIDGERDLTELALTLGFGDHSHFSNAFRREFGAAPSRARRPTTGTELRELSKKLQV